MKDDGVDPAYLPASFTLRPASAPPPVPGSVDPPMLPAVEELPLVPEDPVPYVEDPLVELPCEDPVPLVDEPPVPDAPVSVGLVAPGVELPVPEVWPYVETPNTPETTITLIKTLFSSLFTI